FEPSNRGGLFTSPPSLSIMPENTFPGAHPHRTGCLL
ncbi:hypothetical protein A2U01_0103572, partial [Trifolium medium]|nr:hypothetical protein [Trifolium medium]